jgi:integrase
MLKLVEPGIRSRSPHYYAYGRVKGSGKPIERSLQTSDLREARRRLRELVTALEAEARGPRGGAAAAAEPDVLTFADAIDSYVEAKSPGGYMPGYLDRLKADRIGAKALADVTPGDILKAAHRLHPGCADATKDRNVIVPAPAVLHFAYHEQLRADWIKVQKLDKSTPRNRRPKAGVIERLLKAADDEQRELLLFLHLQGWRITETCTLRWEHVDLTAGTLEVFIRKGKSRGWKTVPANAGVVALLANIAARRGEPIRDGRKRRRDDAFVFPWRSRWSVYNWLKPLARRLGVTITPHMLRHEFGSRHHEAGADTLDLVAIGSWASSKSVERYCHSDIEHAKAVINRISAGVDAGADRGGQTGQKTPGAAQAKTK